MLSTLVCAASLLPAGDTDFARARPGLEINSCGVLTGVPGAGLASIDGPAVRLGAGFAEWFGVSFTEGGVRHHAVGAGNTPDWAARASVQEESFEQRDGWARARASCEALAIESELSLVEDVLFVRVTLTNRGVLPLEGVLYSREWRTGEPLGWTFPPDWEERPAAPDVGVRLWMPDDLAPGASAGLLFSWRIPRGATPPLASVDVPLALWSDVRWPNGLVLGSTNGVSFGDYDADGWIDLFVCESARLLRNVGGLTWELAADLDSVLPATNIRYGSSFGDYDNDGLPDIGTEPRATIGDSCLHLLRNLGGASFVDVATDPALMTGQPCGAPSETICWGDVDADGDLDLFLPVYPRSAGGPGNFFLENLGPTGPGGQYRFVETSRAAGLDNPPGSARPEGAQFVDLDDDGDLELYSNGTLYQNRSSGSPLFVAMSEAGSGIGLSGALDEGAAFFDYDLDGDQDLFIVYTSRGVRLWEGRGDGTFFQGEGTIIDSRDIGLDLGLSAEDWDNDGDIDFTTRQVFRRNMLVEEGARHFTVATHAIPANHLTSATPAWGDWDRDGDLDCALGNWQSVGHFYENVLWGADTPADAKPYVRVRVVRDHPALARGLETEYGANVELVLHGDLHRREKFTASGHGYLNQNEYVLHFALPSGPDPKAPLAGLVFDLVVDFPSDPARGVVRIDRHVNPALGSIRLADLAEREVTVFRSGRVVLDGRTLSPARSGFSDRLRELGGGLSRPDPELGLPEPLLAASPTRWVGLEFTTGGVEVLVKELVLDGTLATGVAPFELALWDVTDPRAPRLVHSARAATSDRNRRTHFPFVVALERGRTYRCAAHVASLRKTTLGAPWRGDALVLKGGLDFEDSDPASGFALTRARPEPLGFALTLRYVVREGRAGR
jgi:hypothetical protein